MSQIAMTLRAPEEESGRGPGRRVIVNPVTGKRMTFLQTEAEEPPIPVIVQDTVDSGLANVAVRLGYSPAFPLHRDVSTPDESILN